MEVAIGPQPALHHVRSKAGEQHFGDHEKVLKEIQREHSVQEMTHNALALCCRSDGMVSVVLPMLYALSDGANLVLLPEEPPAPEVAHSSPDLHLDMEDEKSVVLPSAHSVHEMVQDCLASHFDPDRMKSPVLRSGHSVHEMADNFLVAILGFDARMTMTHSLLVPRLGPD